MREIVTISLGGSEHQLRPTWEAYGEIEARCGPMKALYLTVGTGGATLQTMATIVSIGMRAAGSKDGRSIDEESVSRRLYEAGPCDNETIQVILSYLAALGWTPEQRKKAEAEARAMEDQVSAL